MSGRSGRSDAQETGQILLATATTLKSREVIHEPADHSDVYRRPDICPYLWNRYPSRVTIGLIN